MPGLGEGPAAQWRRRVGLFGTHNDGPFPIKRTELHVKINALQQPTVALTITHRILCTHHTAVFWFPISDMRAPQAFTVEVDGERVPGSLHKAVSEAATVAHPKGAPRELNDLYYFRAANHDALTDLPPNQQIEVRLSLFTELLPVEIEAGKHHPCFMLPVASCFPRGVDDATMEVEMHDRIRSIYVVDPQDEVYPRIRDNTATVAFRKGNAVSENTELLIVGIECGPKVIKPVDLISFFVMAFVVLFGAFLFLSIDTAGHVEDVFE
eukprot:TRINITY_DN9614_c0_g3_i1.p2 TRINITY_DN9614_c0_g3~~TRINITY_DN9614_c0_g3_i1.p2  ORF type:complete len:267 (+),score=107.64 TRINITY_DN9614_c0_g3_i1:40-840(+)